MKKKAQKRSHKKEKINASMPVLRPDAAGIDIGHREHGCAVPADRGQQPVRAFGTFTQDLAEMARWLKRVRHQNGGHGIHRRVLDSGLSDPGTARL